MAATENIVYVDGSFDWTDGVDSGKVTTVESTLNPNGLKRSQLAWLNNGTVRGGAITQRYGWQRLFKLIDSGHYQGGFIYEPDEGYPYRVCSISGIIYSVLLQAPYTITDLTHGDTMLQNPPDAEMAWFCQGENYLVIQAGDYFTGGPEIVGKTDKYGSHLPLFWDGTTLRRSIGINNPAPASMSPNINEIPAATCMEYYGNRIWYAQGRQYSAGDIVGGPSGNAINRNRDSILSVTENPLCFAGDGFTVPTNAGNIRALVHSAQLNTSLGEGQFYICTRKAIYSLAVPTSRDDWITAGTNMPLQTVVQLVNGAVGHRSVTPVNGDLYYQSFDPAIRSLIRAVQYFQQPGNTAVSQNVGRALASSNRALMHFSSSVFYDSRILNLVLPEVALDGLNVIHRAVLPLDFDVVSNFSGRSSPVWEGALDGLQFVDLFVADFGGLQKCFALAISSEDGSLNVWELTDSSKTENGDNRVVWSPEFPAFTWSPSGLEFHLKQLNGGECWIDRVSGTVQMDVYYRGDADPCWRKWFDTEFCALRWQDTDTISAYPCEPMNEGYVFPVVFPEPPVDCNSMGVRPSTIGYQFQVKIVLKGFCRIRGLLLYAYQKDKPRFQGIACSRPLPVGMASIPDATTPQVIPPEACQTAAEAKQLPSPDVPHPPLIPLQCSITTPSLPDGSVGAAYSQQLGLTAEATVYSWAITAGQLPSGLSLNTATGIISGTPTTEESQTFTVTVTGAAAMTCSKEFTLAIGPTGWEDTYTICNWSSVSSCFPGFGGTFTVHLPGPPYTYYPYLPGWYSATVPNYTVLYFSGSKWILESYNSNTGVRSWKGECSSTNHFNPSGVYTKTSGTCGVATIQIVSSSHPELCS